MPMQLQAALVETPPGESLLPMNAPISRTIAVLGAGNGGQMTAAEMTMRGHRVRSTNIPNLRG